MASTGYNFNRPTKETLKQARADGWQVDQRDDGRHHVLVYLRHPSIGAATREFRCARHGDGNNAMVKFLARETKLVKAREREERARDAAAVGGAPAARAAAGKAPPPLDSDVAHAADAIALWLDDEYRAGLRQFTLSALNAKKRAAIGVPNDSRVVEAALARLAAMNVIAEGTLPSASGERVLRAFRLNHFNGTGVVDAYSAGEVLPPAEAPSASDPRRVEPEVADMVERHAPPAEVPPPAPPTGGFAGALAGLVAKDAGMLDRVVDVLIAEGKFAELAAVVVASGDAGACERILRRVAEVSNGGPR